MLEATNVYYQQYADKKDFIQAYIIYLTLDILENFDLIIAEKLRDGAINISCKRQVYYFGDIVHRIKVCLRLSKKMVHQ